MVRGTVIMMLEPPMEASHSIAGGSWGSSQGRDTITIGMINETSVWGISLLENYSQREEVIIVVRGLPGVLLEEMVKEELNSLGRGD